MDFRKFNTAVRNCKTEEERILLFIGREKDELLRIASDVMNGHFEAMWEAQSHLQLLKSWQNDLEKLEEAKDAIEEYEKYLRPWDHDPAHGEADTFAEFGETNESRNRDKERFRVINKRSWKTKRR